MNGRNHSGDDNNGLSDDGFAGYDAIAISGRGHAMAAGSIHVAPGTLDRIYSGYASLLADWGYSPGYPPGPRRFTTRWRGDASGARHRPDFFRDFVRFLAATAGIAVSTATGPGLTPRELTGAVLAERNSRYKHANTTGIAVIRGDHAGPPYTELTGLAIPRAVDPGLLELLPHIARMIAHLARDRHFPNPHRMGLGATLDRMLPGVTHNSF
ncbi:hypothetical protein [Streptomyces sp. NPDC089915]|uniref:hypothetical protein n=1 Tax=Streptomyces sp. NPDC089915 TaxID=3155186 RepID=UPI0034358116